MNILSVIVPTYNTGKYTELCLDSILNQNIDGLELIIIDDASDDETAYILKDYANRYPNVLLFRNETNKGSGFSRNIGIQHASGKYIGFVDSDDWVDINFYPLLLRKAEEAGADVVITGIKNEFGNYLSSNDRYEYHDETLIDGHMGLRLMTKSNRLGLLISPIMNNKIYRREFLLKHQIVCADNHSWQDDYFSFFCMLYAEKVWIVPGTSYHYRQRNGSVTHFQTDPRFKIDNCIDVLRKIRLRLQDENFYEKYRTEYQSFVERCVSSLLQMIRNTKPANIDQDIVYLFECLSQICSIGDVFRYLDSNRVYRFFDL